jgi:hypothetical protein
MSDVNAETPGSLRNFANRSASFFLQADFAVKYPEPRLSSEERKKKGGRRKEERLRPERGAESPSEQ